MSESEHETKQPVAKKHHWIFVLALPAWVLIGFVFAQVILSLIYTALEHIGVSFDGANQAVVNTTFALIVYALTLALVIGVPYLIRKSVVTRKELGMERLPFWSDILLAPAGFIIYMIITSLLAAAAIAWLPGYDVDQVQNTGFSHLNNQSEYILAFFTLVVLAPVAEELLFRGYLFGKLKKHVPVWLAILVTSILFGAVHGSWNVGVDVFALSIVLCLLRQLSGSLWPSILLHMLKNGIAFYILFINPDFLRTLGG